MNTPLQHVWLSRLMAYDFEMLYKQGKESIAAHALSRVYGGTLWALTLSTFDPLLLDKLKTSWEEDFDIQHLIQRIQGPQYSGRFT